MKTKLFAGSFVLAVWYTFLPMPLQAQGTAFSYQGQLNNNGSPANGSYDIQFALYATNTNGTPVAGPVTNLAIGVTNGIFATVIDFGSGVFNGSSNWLDIAVRTNGGATFTELTPREPILPTPYAIFANTASNVSGTISPAQLPATIVTNGATGVNITGTFSGNGGGLTNISGAQLVGTINASQLTVTATNVIAPLTVPPQIPAAAVGSMGTNARSYSVAVSGSYAYLVSDLGLLQVINVSTPSNPIVVGTLATGGAILSIAVAGSYGYIANNPSAGFQVVDVSNPSAPAIVGTLAIGPTLTSVAVAGRYAYAVNDYSNTLQVIDVSIPTNPTVVGTYQAPAGNPDAVAVAGRYAYLAVKFGSFLQTIDVSNPSNPVFVGGVGTAQNPNSVAVAGSYAYVGEQATTQIFDVSNPTNPVLLSTLVGGATSVAVAGRYAYLGSDLSLQIVDVSNPASPVVVGSVGTSGAAQSLAVAGRYAYVATRGFDDNTLQIFDLGGAYIQQMEAGAMETGTLQTRDTMTVGNNLDVRGGLTVSGSARITGGLSVDNLTGGVTTNIVISGHTFYITNGVIMSIQ